MHTYRRFDAYSICPGFLALAQLPVVFLFGTKNSIFSLLLGPGNGYEKLNYIHRWSGRCLFLGGVVHGSLWIRNHLQFDLPIIGQQKETSGVACLGLLCVIVLSSLKPVRKYFYQAFFVIQSVPVLLSIPIIVDFKILFQCPGLRLIFHYHLLPYDIRLALDLPSSGFLWSRCALAYVPIPYQRRDLDTRR